MMVINHFNDDFELSKENEFLIWRESVNLPTRASSIFGLASFAKAQGLSPELYVGELSYEYPDYRFKGYKKSEIEAAEFMSGLHRGKAFDLGVKIEKKDILVEEIFEMLKKNNFLIMRVNAGIFRKCASISQYLVFVQENGKIFVYDPELDKYEVSEEELKESIDTLQTKKKRDFRVLVFSE